MAAQSQPTIVVQLTGGLGNQLFCYAFGRGMSRRLGATLRFHRSRHITGGERPYALNHFRAHANVIEQSLSQKTRIAIIAKRQLEPIGKILRPLLGRHAFELVQDDSMGYHPEWFTNGRNLFARGFWQTESYFKEIESEIRFEFDMGSKWREVDLPLLNRIRLSESVCVHVRRGDYVSNPQYAAQFRVQEAGYFSRAVELLRQSGKPLHFFVFSDDAKWASENLSLGENVEFIPNAATTGRQDHQDFQLMRECNHFITANSSFSWWAAWLGTHPEKQVITPRLWYHGSEKPPADMIPPGWTVL